jgi:hypothetical protein
MPKYIRAVILEKILNRTSYVRNISQNHMQETRFIMLMEILSSPLMSGNKCRYCGPSSLMTFPLITGLLSVAARNTVWTKNER